MWRCITTCPGSTRALEIALAHGSAPPWYRAARVVLGTGEAFGPIESDDRVLSGLHGMTAAMWASSPPPPIMARPRVRELSLYSVSRDAPGDGVAVGVPCPERRR
jgi:hypothetical protein